MNHDNRQKLIDIRPIEKEISACIAIINRVLPIYDEKGIDKTRLRAQLDVLTTLSTPGKPTTSVVG